MRTKVTAKQNKENYIQHIAWTYWVSYKDAVRIYNYLTRNIGRGN